MKIDGACHCGKLAYQAEIDPDRVGVCHCTDCQVLSGSAFSVFVPAPAASFSLRGGEPKPSACKPSVPIAERGSTPRT
jgi:hypothetical protein